MRHSASEGGVRNVVAPQSKSRRAGRVVSARAELPCAVRRSHSSRGTRQAVGSRLAASVSLRLGRVLRREELRGRNGGGPQGTGIRTAPPGGVLLHRDGATPPREV